MTPGGLRVFLAPSGALACQLPDSRQFELAEGQEAKTLLRILQGQLTSRAQLGEDGAPTQAQVRHWERHGEGQWPDDRCPFCIAEGRAVPARLHRHASTPGRSPKVQKIAQGRSGQQVAKTATKLSLEELGL